MMASFQLTDEAATAALGAQLAAVLRHGDVVRLSGDLGAGKSTLARGIIRELTGAEDAPSPTFTFLETYDAPDLRIWHFDFYRLEKPEDVWELGLEEALEDGAVIIEWPERAEAFLPDGALNVRLDIYGGMRQADITAGRQWKARLEQAGIA